MLTNQHQSNLPFILVNKVIRRFPKRGSSVSSDVLEKELSEFSAISVSHNPCISVRLMSYVMRTKWPHLSMP